jgi:hypothetical protein
MVEGMSQKEVVEEKTTKAPTLQRNNNDKVAYMSNSKAKDTEREAPLAKQAKRRFRGVSMPDPSVGIAFDEFTSFTNFLKSSKRVFALLGAGLSASSGLATFRGSDRFWRGKEPSTLSDAQAFYNDPVEVWWMFSYRMMKAQSAKPNAAHLALTKLAQTHEGFFAVNQNIDGECMLLRRDRTLTSQACAKERNFHQHRSLNYTARYSQSNAASTKA